MTSFGMKLILAAVLGLQAGPTERQRIDTAAAGRGRLLYAKHCINCHGSNAANTRIG